MAFPTLTPPTGGCPSGSHTAATMNYCTIQYYSLPEVTGVLVQVSAASDSGGGSQTSAGGPQFSFASNDIKYVMYTTGYAITSITYSAGTATAVMSGGTYEGGNYVCLKGVSVTAYNSCTGAGATLLATTTYTGNTLTQVTWAQSGSPANCTSNCGYMLESCGSSIPGYTGTFCNLPIAAQHQAVALNIAGNVPTYVGSQAWADYATQNTAWIAAKSYPIDFAVYVGSHYYHQTAVVSTGNQGYCVSGTSAPTWNTSGGTTTDGTCVWQDDGTAHAIPQDALVYASWTGCQGNPSGCYTPATASVFNVNSSTCGSGGTSACTAQEVVSGEVIPWETPYFYWMAIFNSCYDGDTYPCNGTHTGNAGVIYHYASWSQAVYMRIGYLVGGESYPYDASLMQTYYGLNALEFIATWALGFNATMGSNYAAWTAAAPAWYPMASTNQCNTGCGTDYQNLPSAVAAYVATYAGYSLGGQGLQSSDLTNTATAGYPCNNAVPASNGWVCLAMTYWPILPVIEQQTDGSSAPVNGGTGCSSTIENNTGILSPLLVFATQHHANALEIYATDIAAAFDPFYVPTASYCVSYAQAQALGYPAALNHAAIGVPSVTSAVVGNAAVKGNATQQ